jgi:hypothetical protein
MSGAPDYSRRGAADLGQHRQAAGAVEAIDQGRGAISMNHRITFTTELDKIEEDILYKVSDEAREAAAGNEALSAITMFCTGIGCPV